MKKEYDEELMNLCLELAKQGIDIEELFKKLKPILDICEQVGELAVKNYNYLKGIKNDNEK